LSFLVEAAGEEAGEEAEATDDVQEEGKRGSGRASADSAEARRPSGKVGAEGGV
jgi:hypothetical protein